MWLTRLFVSCFYHALSLCVIVLHMFGDLTCIITQWATNMIQTFTLVVIYFWNPLNSFNCKLSCYIFIFISQKPLKKCKTHNWTFSYEAHLVQLDVPGYFRCLSNIFPTPKLGECKMTFLHFVQFFSTVWQDDTFTLTLTDEGKT